jgi:uncharacterized protein (TIGR02391 family)
MAWKKDNIELEEIIAESPRRSYEVVRLTRLKYVDNPYTFIDLRVFQRGWDEDKEVYHPTKRGVQFREELFQELIGKWTLVPSLLFHPLVMEKAWPAITADDFDTAVFKAFKAVEVRVRDACDLPDSTVGTTLMRKAFDPASGPLTDMSVPRAEREARSHLFTGCIGLYKNPHSHRDVQLGFNESFEMLLLAGQ